MRQMEASVSFPVVILTLGFFTFVSLAQDNSMTSDDLFLDSELDFDRRPQDVGLGKRVYSYNTEFKRLPVYNFGLGKRSHLYNFGLGKRSRLDEDVDDVEEYDEYPYNDDEDQTPDLELYHDDDMQSLNKRQKIYSFGLGKRFHRYDFGLGKRGHRYDFGLGKRSQSPVNNDKLYNFGLGKRTRLYSFGLGKRLYEGPAPSRFNFGLGKRSGDSSKNVIAKREVHDQRLPDTPYLKSNNQADVGQMAINHFNNVNNSADLESHEVMGHSDKSVLSKRSPYRQNSENGRNSAYRMTSGFSRQFRKPLYNFGLGKRTSLNDLTSENLKSQNN